MRLLTAYAEVHGTGERCETYDGRVMTSTPAAMAESMQVRDRAVADLPGAVP